MLLNTLVLFLLQTCLALRFDPSNVGYNLNENETAVHPSDYWGQWDNHTFNPSPGNWRFPFYALTIDRYVDGDPTNNEANGTVFEHNWLSNQFRFGGDAAGLQSDLDYVQGMGIKAIYFTGSMMINMPWSPDGYGPLDLTLLDRHHGAITEWRALIDDIHSRGMYVIFDTTMSTMGNLLGYEGKYQNATVTFDFNEYDAIWKHPERRYLDFNFGNTRDENCVLPRVWEQNGYLEQQNITEQYRGCRNSEFDMYGDINNTGSYPSYVNQFSRFAAVQDRLREWRPDVLEKINVMSCLQIAMLDIDGFRVDKAVQVTIDALASFSDYQRQCARRFGKENFIVIGEIVADPKLGSVYFGRGKQPDHALVDHTQGIFTNAETNASTFIRPYGMTALDGASFNYDIYGSMTRFLGLDGPWGGLGVDWVGLWNSMLSTHDLVNANTGLFDPRHVFGTTNQDVFRWPALANGTQRQLLGFFIITLELPGIPMLFYGEEQEFYILENLAPDYVFGRTPMASSTASQLHGCYGLGEKEYVNMPFDQVKDGCHDDGVSLDHRNPSHPTRNILKRMFELREQYPVLNDGYNLTTLSTRIHDIYLPGSQGLPSPHGIWSIYRGRSAAVQNFTGIGHGNVPVWLLFQNENQTITYNFDCSSLNKTSENGTIIAPFIQGTTVKNLFYPYDQYELAGSSFSYNLEGSDLAGGCLPQITFSPWEFKAFVPIAEWQSPKPVVTHVSPGHDQRILSSVAYDQTESITIELGFSTPMDCASIADSLQIESTTQVGVTASLNKSSVVCNSTFSMMYGNVGEVPTTFLFSAQLNDVANGIHTFTLDNATTLDGTMSTMSRDKFMFRIGFPDNPMVFIKTANYTKGVLHQDPSSGALYVTPRAAGADKMRYSTNWGSSYSDWQPYTGQNTTLTKQSWSGTKSQEWEGEHVMLQFWSRMSGSTDHIIHSDLARDNLPPRRWPHAWAQGAWNQWGFDAGIKNDMSQDAAGNWTYNLFTEWPSSVVVNIWGMNPDGQPDRSASYGDVDGDGILDWLPPDSLASNVINISTAPAPGYLGYTLVVNDGTYSYSLRPHGSVAIQIIVIILLSIIPLVTASLAVFAFMGAFYKVKFNKMGTQANTKSFTRFLPRFSLIMRSSASKANNAAASSPEDPLEWPLSNAAETALSNALAADAGSPLRRTVLIATMEYEIEDWAVKIKIGGLGVMASLMGKNLSHQDLIWVVPCVGGIDFPFEQDSNVAPMKVHILDQVYNVEVHYHVVRNITFVLLDAPIFRERTKAEPYPPRMDDLESGIYYSTWNQCIAEAIRRFRPDLYHINDYHGACAPLYLLPEIVPCCLSLHNAEFQGMWPLQNVKQMEMICGVFNLSGDTVRKYVQFGNVFNLLHAGARYLYIHQDGFGAVGVSKKYGTRSRERYAIFWCLDKIDALPNPDPTDLAPFDKDAKLPSAEIDIVQEQQREKFRCEAQEWAGLKVDPKAELFVFVGRWSQQKGIDLIADVFPSVLKNHPNTQLICVGPVIDLYGRFAALKLEKLMVQYPGRVYSKPEFTALPPCIFSGAEFALMPSRDEPFGLVAVEFGRKGALCVGSRVGGFGHMPGWWFTVEAVTSKHLISQFNAAISAAISSNTDTRALMRAWSKLQRFPVAQWVEDLEKLQTSSIELSMAGRFRGDRLTKLLDRGSQLLSLPISSASTSRGITRRSTPSSLNLSIGRGNPASTIRSDNCPSTPATPQGGLTPTDAVFGLSDIRNLGAATNYSSNLSLNSVTSGNAESSLLQNAAPIFLDKRNTYYDQFSQKLDKLAIKQSSGSMLIEEYLVQSEKDWFNKYHNASLSPRLPSSGNKRLTSSGEKTLPTSTDDSAEFVELLGDDYQAPRGVKVLMQRKVGTWYIYSYLLALGQILSASSLQLTLLEGAVGQAASILYTLCGIYAVSSLCWWIIYRRFKAIYVLSAPFYCFGLCFFLLGMSYFAKDSFARGWIFHVATGVYTVGSSAGSLYFTLNFGTEGGTPPQTWALRACIITGTQQLLIAFLWNWVTSMSNTSGPGQTSNSFILPSVTLIEVALPLALLMWVIGTLLFCGLPDYYRQNPGAVPSFYKAVCRKHVVMWFWVMVVLQGYWLSSTASRNWTFLWSSQHAPRWVIALVVVFFFVVVWSGALAILARLTKQHSWIIPIFAIGLGAPAWCQMLWGISGIGQHVPWAGAVGGAILSRCVWLWLGVLHAVQDVGFGMILLMTLTRLHIAFVFIMAQIIGSAITMLARATSPNKLGPGEVYINIAGESIVKPWFWICLACQLVICAGYFKFFRKAQLMKP